MHRFARIAAYMGPQWMAWFEFAILGRKRAIRESIEDEAVFQRTAETLTAALAGSAP